MDPGTSWENCDKLTNQDYVYDAVKNGPLALKAPTKPKDDFTNTNEAGCPIIFSVVKSDGSALDAGFSNWIYINSNDELELNEYTYTGGDHTLKVKAVTNFGTPLFKTITITEKCGRQTHTVLDPTKVYLFQAVFEKTGFKITSATRPQDDITNSDAVVCPTDWSLVKADGSPLDGWLATSLVLNAGGYIELD